MTQQSFQGRTSSRSSEYGTPEHIFNPLNDEFHFEFDLAATARSTKVAGAFFTKEDDALTRDWPRVSCFLNPPYSRRVGRWIQKARDESLQGTQTVVLINANTESQWYQHIAVPFAHEIRHLEYRIPFIDWEAVYRMEQDGATQLEVQDFIDSGEGSYHPSCVLVFGTDQTTIPVRRVGGVGRYHYVSF
jgi:site-specific DNA-methyltransferase (adenine-specific)